MKVKHVYLSAQQPAALAEFYLKVGVPVRFADSNRWIQFQTEGAAFCIAGPGESASTTSKNAVVVFEVDDIAAMVKRAIEAGAVLIAPLRDMGDHGRVGQIRDPDGNVVQFYEAAKKAGNA